MKAFTKYRYGAPDVLHLEEVEKPEIQPNQILVKIKANSANPADWHVIRGKPFFARLSFGLFKPKKPIAGADFAGIVEAVGNKIQQFKVGDHVFGESLQGGAFAEYIAIDEKVCGAMTNHDFSSFAGLPIAGITALQSLITHGQMKKGEKVLINGSSGGVGHFAVQIAKAYGAEVTAVCSAKNIEFVKNLGADHVIAYDKKSIRKHNEKYDLVIDNHGNLRHQDFKRLGHRGVIVGFTSMGHLFSLMLLRAFNKFPLAQFTAAANTEDLNTLASLIEEKKIKIHIDKSYAYTSIPEAIAYIEDMRTKGKVIMTW